MGVLSDNTDDKNAKKQAEISVAEDRPTGYATPLFKELPPKWSDDRIGSEKVETRYHDKDMVLKVTNGLCYDIFFRAEDVFRPDFDEIPQFWEDIQDQSDHKNQQKPELQKPLDSKHRQRTYILTPEKQEEQSASAPQKTGEKRKPRRRSRQRNRMKRK